VVMDGWNEVISYLVNLTIKTPLEVFSLIWRNFFSPAGRPISSACQQMGMLLSGVFCTDRDREKYSLSRWNGTIRRTSALCAGYRVKWPERDGGTYNTIVDLLRNDLSRIATSVKVNRSDTLMHWRQTGIHFTGKFRDRGNSGGRVSRNPGNTFLRIIAGRFRIGSAPGGYAFASSKEAEKEARGSTPV
jgi:para-aminobenzoate synthetase component 1